MEGCFQALPHRCLFSSLLGLGGDSFLLWSARKIPGIKLPKQLPEVLLVRRTLAVPL